MKKYYTTLEVRLVIEAESESEARAESAASIPLAFEDCGKGRIEIRGVDVIACSEESV